MRVTLKAIACFPLFLALGLSIAACSPQPEADDTAEIVTQPDPTPSEDDNQEVTAEPPGKPKILPFEEDGPVADYRPGGAEFSGIPIGWPEELPLPASGELLTADRVDEEKEFYQLYFGGTARADFDSLVQQLTDGGFKMLPSSSESDLVFVFENQDFYVEVLGNGTIGLEEPQSFIYLVYWEWPGLGTH